MMEYMSATRYCFPSSAMPSTCRISRAVMYGLSGYPLTTATKVTQLWRGTRPAADAPLQVTGFSIQGRVDVRVHLQQPLVSFTYYVNRYGSG